VKNPSAHDLASAKQLKQDLEQSSPKKQISHRPSTSARWTCKTRVSAFQQHPRAPWNANYVGPRAHHRRRKKTRRRREPRRILRDRWRPPRHGARSSLTVANHAAMEPPISFGFLFCPTQVPQQARRMCSTPFSLGDHGRLYQKKMVEALTAEASSTPERLGVTQQARRGSRFRTRKTFVALETAKRQIGAGRGLKFICRTGKRLAKRWTEIVHPSSTHPLCYFRKPRAKPRDQPQGSFIFQP